MAGVPDGERRFALQAALELSLSSFEMENRPLVQT
jgi:hypothetical protein